MRPSSSLFAGAAVLALLAAACAPPTGRRVTAAEFDPNGDGRFSADEYVPATRIFFDTLDQNADGRVDVFERIPMWRAPDTVKAELRATDADDDGTITRAEFDAFSLARFRRMDVDSDGYLTPGELRREGRRLRAERGEPVATARPLK